MAHDDPLLLARIAAGDGDALHELYQRYAPRLTRYLWHQLDGDSHAVEEALQEVFVAIWRSSAGFRSEAKVATWVYQIAHNTASSARRRERRWAAAAQAPILEPDESPDSGETLPACDDAVLDRLVLTDALRQLSAKHREALRLVVAEGFSHDEVARMLDIPIGTVKSRLSYARRALLRALNTRDPEASHP